MTTGHKSDPPAASCPRQVNRGAAVAAGTDASPRPGRVSIGPRDPRQPRYNVSKFKGLR